MARVQVTVRALGDLERLFDFLAEHNPKLERERNSKAVFSIPIARSTCSFLRGTIISPPARR